MVNQVNTKLTPEEQSKAHYFQVQLQRYINSSKYVSDPSVFQKTQQEKFDLKQVRTSHKNLLKGWYGKDFNPRQHLNLPLSAVA